MALVRDGDCVMAGETDGTFGAATDTVTDALLEAAIDSDADDVDNAGALEDDAVVLIAGGEALVLPVPSIDGRPLGVREVSAEIV
jgi:hypothetical protein